MNDVAMWLTIICELLTNDVQFQFISLCVGRKRKPVVYLQRLITDKTATLYESHAMCSPYDR